MSGEFKPKVHFDQRPPPPPCSRHRLLPQKVLGSLTPQLTFPFPSGLQRTNVLVDFLALNKLIKQ